MVYITNHPASSIVSKRLSPSFFKGVELILVKVVTWRIISVLLTLLITLLMTGDIHTATRVTVVLHTLLILTHYIFESTWEKKFNSKPSGRGRRQ